MDLEIFIRDTGECMGCKFEYNQPVQWEILRLPHEERKFNEGTGEWEISYEFWPRVEQMLYDRGCVLKLVEASS